ncbi:MAG: hypothetical protein FWD57_06870 [Polyangiaceae bacterium]|nr:hypothetical protein [Polyangiaceae bacterium]
MAKLDLKSIASNWNGATLVATQSISNRIGIEHDLAVDRCGGDAPTSQNHSVDTIVDLGEMYGSRGNQSACVLDRAPSSSDSGFCASAEDVSRASHQQPAEEPPNVLSDILSSAREIAGRAYSVAGTALSDASFVG